MKKQTTPFSATISQAPGQVVLTLVGEIDTLTAPEFQGAAEAMGSGPGVTLVFDMRALGDEQFDVLHLHEPFLPGPTHTAMLLHPAPVVATFHAAGVSASYKYLRSIIKPAAENIAHDPLQR